MQLINTPLPSGCYPNHEQGVLLRSIHRYRMKTQGMHTPTAAPPADRFAPVMIPRMWMWMCGKTQAFKARYSCSSNAVTSYPPM